MNVGIGIVIVFVIMIGSFFLDAAKAICCVDNTYYDLAPCTTSNHKYFQASLI